MLAYTEMKQVVVSLDFSDAGTAIVAAAIELAKALQARVTLLHVLEPQPTYSAYGFSPEEFPAIQSFQEQAKQRAQQHLDQIAAKVAGNDLATETQLLAGSPAREIESFLRDAKDTWLVLGTHGHNWVGSILLGSVAESLVRRAVVPTLVVPIAQD